jgi:hypothetical protein
MLSLYKQFKTNIMRKEFNTLVETLKRWDLYQLGDEVDMDLKSLEDKIIEVEKRMECIEKCAEEINEAIGGYTSSVDNNETFIMSGSDIEIIMRGSHDIEIALDLNDTEVIENNWYGLFAEPKENVSRETLEEPPTSLCKTPQTHEFVKDIIAKLKVIDVDGETMQYILEQVGMDGQMLIQLIKSCEHLEQVEEIIDEARSIK